MCQTTLRQSVSNVYRRIQDSGIKVPTSLPTTCEAFFAEGRSKHVLEELLKKFGDGFASIQFLRALLPRAYLPRCWHYSSCRCCPPDWFARVPWKVPRSKPK